MSARALPFGEFLLVMAERCQQGPAPRDQVLDCLRQIEEAFDGELDPADAFDAYAAWRLCRAIRAALEAG